MDKLKDKILLFLEESSSLEDFFNKIDSLTSEEKEKSADILFELGIENYFKGDWKKAIKFYEKALAIDKEFKNKKGESACYTNIGVIYYNLGEYEKALEYYNMSLAIKKDLVDRIGEMIIRINLGLLLTTLKKFSEAERQAILAERIINELNLKDSPFGKEMVKFIEKIKNKEVSKEDLKEFSSLVKKFRQ